MLLASKIGWAGIAFAFLTTGIFPQDLPRSAAGSDFPKEANAVFVSKNEIKKMQETLRNRGHYRGKIDGFFGLRTRASVRAYQKAENLPITGQIDLQTADGLGLRPESTWDSSEISGRHGGHGSDIAAGGAIRGKPSAGIRWTEGRGSKTSRQGVSRATAIDDNSSDGPDKPPTENEQHHQ